MKIKKAPTSTSSGKGGKALKSESGAKLTLVKKPLSLSAELGKGHKALNPIVVEIGKEIVALARDARVKEAGYKPLPRLHELAPTLHKLKENFFQEQVDEVDSEKAVPDKKTLARRYRARLPYHDEALSTVNVVLLTTALLEAHLKKPFPKTVISDLSKVIDDISAVRLPTKYVGRSLKPVAVAKTKSPSKKAKLSEPAEISSQHPTERVGGDEDAKKDKGAKKTKDAKGTKDAKKEKDKGEQMGLFGPVKGGTHGRDDLGRRNEAILALRLAMEHPKRTVQSLLRAALVQAGTYMLDVMVAPGLAENVLPHLKGSPPAKGEVSYQTMLRSGSKRQLSEAGAMQVKTSNKLATRAWPVKRPAPPSLKRMLSDDRLVKKPALEGFAGI